MMKGIIVKLRERIYECDKSMCQANKIKCARNVLLQEIDGDRDKLLNILGLHWRILKKTGISIFQKGKIICLGMIGFTIYFDINKKLKVFQFFSTVRKLRNRLLDGILY